MFVHTSKRKDDEGLWHALRQGDHEAYEIIFKEHYKFLLNYGLKFFPNREEVKDCIQALFANLWHSRERLGTNTSIKSYLAASLRRIILRKVKKAAFTASIDAKEARLCSEISHEAKRIILEDEMQLTSRLREAVGKLPSRQKEALYLKYYGGHTFQQIGEIMGISTRAVYKLMYKALGKLNNKLSPSGNHEGI